VKVFVGLPSYNRADVLRLCLSSFSNSKLVKGFIVVADSASEDEAQHYVEVVKEVTDLGFEALHDIRVGKRGSARARNAVLEMAKKHLSDDDVLVLYDDDYLYPGDHALARALSLLRDASIGIVGGRVVNLRRRRVDPDFSLNVPRLADALTRLTGFIVLNTKHGPREVDFTTPLMAVKVGILNRGIKYDESYEGIGYREESDLQRQVKDLGLKIVFEPRFYAYHLAVEEGGNRYSDLEDRMYWKWRNHAYFVNKWRYPVYKRVLSYMILTVYTALNGLPAIRGMVKATKPSK
jgi:glycosyltransferase involved in cell wall biosynthesis